MSALPNQGVKLTRVTEGIWPQQQGPRSCPARIRYLHRWVMKLDLKDQWEAAWQASLMDGQ